MTDDVGSEPPPPPPPPTGAPLSTAGPTGQQHAALLDVGDWLTDTTRTMVKGFGDFFAVMTLVALVSAAVTAPLLWVSSADAIVRRNDAGAFTEVDGMSTNQILMVAVGLLFSLVAQVLLFTAATNHIDRRRSGEEPRWQETLHALVTRSPRVLGVVIQVVIGAFLMLMVAGVLAGVGLGDVGLLVALIGIVWLWLRSAIGPTHAALGLDGASLRSSFSWTKGLTWPLLGRHVLLMTLVVGLLLISSFAATPFQALSGATAAAEGDVVLRDVIGQSFAAFAAVQFINALASGLIAALWAAAMLSLLRGELTER